MRRNTQVNAIALAPQEGQAILYLTDTPRSVRRLDLMTGASATITGDGGALGGGCADAQLTNAAALYWHAPTRFVYVAVSSSILRVGPLP